MGVTSSTGCLEIMCPGTALAAKCWSKKRKPAMKRSVVCGWRQEQDWGWSAWSSHAGHLPQVQQQKWQYHLVWLLVLLQVVPCTVRGQAGTYQGLGHDAGWTWKSPKQQLNADLLSWASVWGSKEIYRDGWGRSSDSKTRLQKALNTAHGHC